MITNEHFCCQDMIYYLNNNIIFYSDKFDEYGIVMNDEVSFLLIGYCPWCGKNCRTARESNGLWSLKNLVMKTLYFATIFQSITNLQNGINRNTEYGYMH